MSHLPASTKLLGIWVKALDARRHATGKRAEALKDRTASRCFAGEVCTRQWCCPLTGLLHFLLDEHLIDATGEDRQQGETCLFLSFAAIMQRWEHHRTNPAVAPLACFRAAALDLLFTLRVLGQGGFGLCVSRTASEEPAWLGPVALPPLLVRMRETPGCPTLKALAHTLGYPQATVGRWFSRGERPQREALQVLAKHCAPTLNRTWESIYRELYWHYSLRDVAIDLQAWLGRAELEDFAHIGRVALNTRCSCCSDPLRLPEPRAMAFAFLDKPLDVLASQIVAGGVTRTWLVDVATRQTTLVPPMPDQHPQKQLVWHLERMPRKRPRQGQPHRSSVARSSRSTATQ